MGLSVKSSLIILALNLSLAPVVSSQPTFLVKDHQPGGTLNAGPVFRNPAGDSAGAIIDRCGLKGTTVGPVGISEVHANFLVASGDATSNDIHAFVFEIQAKVFELTGITLEPEIRFLGSFAPRGVEA